MRLAIDPTVAPVGSGAWYDRVSVAQAPTLTAIPRANIESNCLRSWKWARVASQAATDLASRYPTDSPLYNECLRIAKRHDGVWRACNKLVRYDEKTRKEIRSIVAVRSDAGDSTCPTFLERQGKKRWKEMYPIFEACSKLGFTIAVAQSPAIPRARIYEALTQFANASWRAAYGIEGADILIVPTANNMVIAHVLVAFRSNVHNITLPITFDFTRLINTESFYDAPACAANTLGPAIWIESQLSRFKDGKRSRDRLSYGCFYGEASESLIIRAANLDRQAISPESAKALAETESLIAQSIELTKRCLQAGDLEAAKAAYGFVGAYLYDASVSLAAYPVLAKSLVYLSRVDFSGCDDLPALPATHDLLMEEVRSLPSPKPHSLPQWRCIELVSVHSIADMMQLIAWVKEETT